MPDLTLLKMTQTIKDKMRVILCCLILSGIGLTKLHAQNHPRGVELTFSEVIKIAQDSSLQSLISENSVFSAYWRYKNFRTRRLPTVGVTARPFTYSRRITQQFDNQDNSFRYFEIENLNSYAQLSIDQNILPTGGRVSVDTDLGRLVNFGDVNETQFSATQVRIALDQPLFAHNAFKWDKMIEPLEYKKSKMEFVQSAENIAMRAIGFYFDVLSAEMTSQIAETNMNNADTLYQIGIKREALTTITQPDLLNLKLEYLNSQSSYVKAQNELNRALVSLRTFLNIDESVEFKFGEEEEIIDLTVPVDQALDMAISYNPDYLGFQSELMAADKNVDRTKKESRFQASLNASAGLNQRGPTLSDAYVDPLDQQEFNLTLSIPILDWGLAKGRYKVASRERERTRLSIKQQEVQIEQEIINTIQNFNLKSQLLSNAREASQVAVQVYELNKVRFVQGLIDVNTLIIYQQRKDNAVKNYISELRDYWRTYHYIRSITLYDFHQKVSLASQVDDQLSRLLD